jgi:hypothetical protein
MGHAKFLFCTRLFYHPSTSSPSLLRSSPLSLSLSSLPALRYEDGVARIMDEPTKTASRRKVLQMKGDNEKKE